MVVDVYGCLFYISFVMLLARLLLFVYICGLFDILFAVDLVILHVVCAVVVGGFGFFEMVGFSVVCLLLLRCFCVSFLICCRWFRCLCLIALYLWLGVA